MTVEASGQSTERLQSRIKRAVRAEVSRSPGSCGTMVNRDRKSSRPILEMSIPSIRIEPECASTKRKKEAARVLLPQPVEPTMPTFSPALIEKVKSWRTSGSSGA